MKKFLFAAVFYFLGTLVFTQERIAVFPFEDMENVLTRNEMLMFYREFSNEFTNRSSVNISVVPRQEVERLIDVERAFQLSVFSAREKTAEMERVLNGTQILSGLIGKLGNNIRITVSLYTYPEIRQLPGGTTLSAANKDELFSKISELVRNMQSEIAGGNSAYTQQEYDNENEFLIIPLDGGTARIIQYNGIRQTIRIPPQIQGMTVTEIGNEAFQNKQLTSVTIPNSVTIIGVYAFPNNQLTNVTIPNSVTVIGDWAFYQNQLTSVTIPNSVTVIGEAAFNHNQLRNVTIPNSVTTIRFLAFANNQLTSITIPNSVTTIEKWAFAVNQLTSVTIPNSVTTIGDKAFENNQLANITLSRRTQLGENVFPDSALITYRD